MQHSPPAYRYRPLTQATNRTYTPRYWSNWRTEQRIIFSAWHYVETCNNTIWRRWCYGHYLHRKLTHFYRWLRFLDHIYQRISDKHLSSHEIAQNQNSLKCLPYQTIAKFQLISHPLTSLLLYRLKRLDVLSLSCWINTSYSLDNKAITTTTCVNPNTAFSCSQTSADQRTRTRLLLGKNSLSQRACHEINQLLRKRRRR